MLNNGVGMGKTEKYINSIIESGKGVFMGLIDPDKQDPEKGVELAKIMYEGGADVILIGGSIGAQGTVFNETARLIKENVGIPLMIFPGNVSAVTEYADSIYFMSLINSKNPYWITGAQSLGAPMIKQSRIEPIPTAYMVFEPGETVGRVGEANLLPRDKPDLAIAYSLAAKYLGMRFAILESGSGAPEHVPVDIVKAIRNVCDLKLIIAGGVKTPEQARALIEAGANCIHIGTKIEEDAHPLRRVREFAKAIHLE